MALVQKYLNPFILNPKTLFKYQKQFLQHVYVLARILLVACVLFRWNRPAMLGHSGQVGPPVPSPVLLPSAKMESPPSSVRAIGRPPRVPWRWDSSCCAPPIPPPLEWVLPVTPSPPLNALKPLAIDAIEGHGLTTTRPSACRPGL
jgi:hypothetical protein